MFIYAESESWAIIKLQELHAKGIKHNKRKINRQIRSRIKSDHSYELHSP